MGTKHRHYDVIVAWAAGEEVEYKNELNEWVDLAARPLWYEYIEYRIKPKRMKKEGWVNVYRTAFGQTKSVLLDSKVQADSWASERRLACIRIEWEEESV